MKGNTVHRHTALRLGILIFILVAVVQMAHAVNATGGIITTNNGNRIHTFTNGGTFVVTEAGNISLLVVAGGGAGGPLNGSAFGGGGGAGGLIYTQAYFVSTGTISVVVGAGGVAQGVSGANSSFGPAYWTNALGVTLTNAVGGGGGGNDTGNGLPGGSGGGGGHIGGNIGGTNILGQGYAGGTIYGGGGGAGAVGTNNNGSGGIGRQLSISGTAQYYAGGGGGAGGGHGGLGGGGSSLASGVAGTAGTNGLGGGGGAGWSSVGGVGGSGIVIVSYPLDIYNLSPSNIVSGAAYFNGLIPDGANFTTVSVYWGTTDGGTNAALWANTNVFSGGPWNVGSVLSTNIALSPSQDYFYTYYASNSAAGGAMAVAPSQYFMDGELTLAATDAVLGTSPTDTATVVVSRPSNCTNGALTVNYTCSSSLTNGVNYSASPASGALVIPAGQTSASITLTPLQYSYGVAGGITVNLASGPYLIGSPSTANCMLKKWTIMATSATGGIITTNVTAYGNYRVHTFTNDGAFTATAPGNVLVLAVAGGGGGGGGVSGSFYGSGGGAGGLIYTNTFISAGTNTVTIGAGGAGGTIAAPLGTNGGNTIFGSLIAIGGGGGSGGIGGSTSNGFNGGSGGGCWYGCTGGSKMQPSSASGGYGNNGGSGGSGNGGGGGGAGAAAVNGNGNGADGLPFSISGTGTVYYAGGGSGAGWTYASKGGGGASISTNTSQAGAANSGGGGGGGWNHNPGAGGAGIVIVSYPIAPPSSGTLVCFH